MLGLIPQPADGVTSDPGSVPPAPVLSPPVPASEPPVLVYPPPPFTRPPEPELSPPLPRLLPPVPRPLPPVLRPLPPELEPPVPAGCPPLPESAAVPPDALPPEPVESNGVSPSPLHPAKTGRQREIQLRRLERRGVIFARLSGLPCRRLLSGHAIGPDCRSASQIDERSSEVFLDLQLMKLSVVAARSSRVRSLSRAKRTAILDGVSVVLGR
jgi:hypothetical protein